MMSIDASEILVRQIRGEFLESPGLRLSAWQIQRLWSLQADECWRALHHLVQLGFLRQAADGAFVRHEG